MTTAPFVHVRWLTPGDARAVARVERAVNPRAGRAGARDIRAALENARDAGTNLGMGLFAGKQLVGYFLAWYQPDRRAAFEEFELECEVSARLEGGAVYVEDVAVLPAHEHHGPLLFRRWSREIARLHPDSPLDAFCRPAALEMWLRHARVLRRVDPESATVEQLSDPSTGETWHWLSWPPQPAPAESAAAESAPAAGLSDAAAGQAAAGAHAAGSALEVPGLPPGFEARVIRSLGDWQGLAADWARLAAAMPEAGPFWSLELQQTWWRHFGLSRRLLVVALYRDGRVVGIAPLMVAPQTFFGRLFGTLQFIGDHSLMERPDVLADPAEPAARALLWQCVAATRADWQAALMYEQIGDPDRHPLIQALPAGQFLARYTAPLLAPHVALDGDWETYLGGRSKTLRKSYGRKLRRLQEAGALQFLAEDGGGDGERVLERYLELETRSWKHAAGQGVGSKAGHAGYYRELCRRLAPRDELRCCFLNLDGQPIAAALGLLRDGRFVSLEICHDEAYDKYSPGFVLTGLELQAAFADPDCRDYDFLSGTLENKLSWATGVRESCDLYVLPNDAHGRLALAWMFRVKPAIKRLLDRLRLRKAVFDTIERLRRRLGLEETL